MCNVCGCETGNTEQHVHDSHHNHAHAHAHDRAHEQNDRLHYGLNEARVSVAGFESDHLVSIEKNILEKNDSYAALNRNYFRENNLLAVNLVASPGAGKTSLLIKTIEQLNQSVEVFVIEGDQETANDAEKIRSTGVEAVQINTGKGCHLDAHMVGHAVEKFHIGNGGLVMIENVGNLVCPASFDLGETFRVVILSVTEGEDKPIKYPDIFAAADVMIVSKTDLLPYLKFDVDQAIEYAKRVNPDIEVIQLSAESGDGMNEWAGWLMSEMAQIKENASNPSIELEAAANA